MSLPKKTLGRTGHSATRLGLGGEGVLRTFGHERQALAVHGEDGIRLHAGQHGDVLAVAAPRLGRPPPASSATS